MKLSATLREANKKSDAKKNRRQGEIPAVLYGAGQSNRNIIVKLDEIQAMLRGIRQGLLATTIFELQLDGKSHKVLIKDIQYQHATYAILHLDFLLLSDKHPVQVNVPIQMIGASDCVGVKLGGFLRQAIRSMKVSCLPKDIPQEFVLDVREMNIADSKRLGDIVLPSTVKPLAKLNEVAVVITKKS